MVDSTRFSSRTSVVRSAENRVSGCRISRVNGGSWLLVLGSEGWVHQMNLITIAMVQVSKVEGYDQVQRANGIQGLPMPAFNASELLLRGTALCTEG